MKVLFIADCLYQELNGARQSANAHLNTLYELVGKDNVTVIALTGKMNVNDNDIITYKGYSNQIMLFINSILGYTTFINKKIETEIIEKHLTKEFDIVFIDNSFFGSLAKKIKESFPDIMLVSYYHDVKQHLCQEWIKKNSLFKIPLFKAMMKNERMNQKYCDVNLTLNKRESKLFNKYYNSLPTAELGVYLDIKKENNMDIKNEIEDVLNILFVGTYYYPNVNGILWFINEVIPILCYPIELTIVGNGMEKLKNENLPECVKVIGRVESLSKYYEESDLVIGPIFEGGGMKVKTAEAFGYGKAMVGTNENFVGYLENIKSEYINELIYVCDDKNDYAKALKSIREKKRIKKYNSEIRGIFDECYSVDAAKKILKKVLELKSK